MNGHQPNLPLDERFRQSEQYALDFTGVPKPQSVPADYVKVEPCTRNCNACRHCDDN